MLDILNDFARHENSSDTGLDPNVAERLIAGLHAHPTTVILLALLEEKPAGVAVCFRGYSTFAAQPLINIHDIAVKAEFRGRGIGRALLKEVESVARALNCCKITLEVRGDNHGAQRLYKRSGYDSGEPPTQFWTKNLQG